jgi:hypothetical protein
MARSHFSGSIKTKPAEFLGRVIATRAAASIIAFSFVWVSFQQFELSYMWLYTLGGGVAVVIVFYCWQSFPLFPEKVTQTKKIILRKRYWLYYALQFMSGARRTNICGICRLFDG